MQRHNDKDKIISLLAVIDELFLALSSQQCHCYCWYFLTSPSAWMYRSLCIFQVILGVMTVSAHSTRVQKPPKWWQHQHVKQYTAVRVFSC